MDGRAVLILPFVMSRKVFKNYKDASMEAEEIDYFLLHQANDRMLDKMSKNWVSLERKSQQI